MYCIGIFLGGFKEKHDKCPVVRVLCCIHASFRPPGTPNIKNNFPLFLFTSVCRKF